MDLAYKKPVNVISTDRVESVMKKIEIKQNRILMCGTRNFPRIGIWHKPFKNDIVLTRYELQFLPTKNHLFSKRIFKAGKSRGVSRCKNPLIQHFIFMPFRKMAGSPHVNQ
jgi:hypothetical protein